MNQNTIRVAVVGVGEFGRNHARVWSEMEGAELVGVVDSNPERAAQVAAEFKTRVLRDVYALSTEKVDAVSLAVPTKEHARVGCNLLDSGIDVLVEKPMASSVGEANGLMASAQRANRILQIGHLERYNSAVVAVRKIISRPMFFEIHRLGVFTPRSLDVDVVYDVMIHDLDILLSLVPAPITDIKAVGIPVMTDKVDIAQARIEFETGTVANLTASRVSTERVRKLRLFQPHQYISLDYQKQEAVAFTVSGNQQIGFQPLAITKEEPLRLEVESFLEAVANRGRPLVPGEDGLRALEVARAILDKIEEHAKIVTERLQSLT